MSAIAIHLTTTRFVPISVGVVGHCFDVLVLVL